MYEVVPWTDAGVRYNCKILIRTYDGEGSHDTSQGLIMKPYDWKATNECGTCPSVRLGLEATGMKTLSLLVNGVPKSCRRAVQQSGFGPPKSLFSRVAVQTPAQYRTFCKFADMLTATKGISNCGFLLNWAFHLPKPSTFSHIDRCKYLEDQATGHIFYGSNPIS